MYMNINHLGVAIALLFLTPKLPHCYYLFLPTYVVRGWGSEDWYAPSIADGHFHKISTWEEVHMNHVCSSIGFLTKLAHPSSWIAQHGPLITWIALVASISNQWSMPFPIKMWAITRFICWYETKWCWYQTKWHCWSDDIMCNTARGCLLVMFFSKLFGRMNTVFNGWHVDYCL